MYIDAINAEPGMVIDHPGFRCIVSSVSCQRDSVVIRVDDDAMSMIFNPYDRVHVCDDSRL